MIFSSVQYLIFLPLVVVLFWRTKGSARLWILLAASYLFYMSWLPIYGLLLLAFTLGNWSLGLLIGKLLDREKLAQLAPGIEASLPAESRDSSGEKVQHTPGPLVRAVFWFGILANVGCLIYYKYTNFFLQVAADFYNVSIAPLSVLLPTLHLPGVFEPPVYQIILPLAISFFVFEFVHYLTDIYRGAQPVRSLLQFSVFASFFPSQIAGPIKRFQDFLQRLLNPEPLKAGLFFEGGTLFMQGLFKKVAIADPLGGLIFTTFQTTQMVSGPDAWLAAFGFVIQVYCDFSGYTDMGRGSALMMGIRLPENFNLPFLASDIIDFWRRWHMSLSFWLRDYVYIPLGGSRGSTLNGWRNSFITMVVCGLWHGANWHYVLFGAIQGVALIINREYKILLARFVKVESLLKSSPGLAFSNLITFLFIIFSFVLFRSPDIPRAVNIYNGMLSFSGECTLWTDVIKSGVMPISLIYFGAWLLTYILSRHPHWLPFLRHPQTGYAYPLKLASWTTAAILMVAVRPVVAVPFVYFQF